MAEKATSPTGDAKTGKTSAKSAAPKKTAASKKTTPPTKTDASKKSPSKTAPKKVTSEETSGKPLKLHHLKPAPGSNRDKMRKGRGEGSKGKTAGRGTKGTKARSTVPVGFEGGQTPIHMRIPKLKGFKNRFRTEYQVVNVSRLVELFDKGGDIGPEELAERGAVRPNRLVKILGDGNLSGIVLHVKAHAFSSSAKAAIEAAGGTATVV